MPSDSTFQKLISQKSSEKFISLSVIHKPEKLLSSDDHFDISRETKGCVSGDREVNVFAQPRVPGADLEEFLNYFVADTAALVVYFRGPRY